MLLAAMLAMVLAAAAPAFAQQTAGQTAAAGGNVAQYTLQNRAICQNVLGAVGVEAGQYGLGGQVDADDIDVGSIAQYLGISVSQVNQCLVAATASPAAAATATATATATAAASPTATATATLPPTGGPAVPSSALALGAGALLVAGGLLARRIVR
jgi:hypothetical protein